MKKSTLSMLIALSLASTTNTWASQDELIFKPGADTRFNWASFEQLKAIDLSGQELTVFGPWLGSEKERFDNVIAYFAKATGAKVSYAGSDSFEQQIVIDAQAGSAPNISIFPQPGLAADLAAKGLLTPLDAEDEAAVKKDYAAGQSWVDLATFKDQDGNNEFYGVFYRADLKSLVWYSPDNFYDAGYDVPETMEDLKALTEQIAADGGTPWCIGLGSGAATGWPATDWVEDLMLRTQPADVYDQWVKNEVKFDDPRVVGAIEEFGWFAHNDAFVDGGIKAVAATDFRDSPKGLFASPPKCYMHRQASFITGFFPKGLTPGEDYDFFPFPPIDEKWGTPALVAGDVIVMLNDTPEARQLVEYLASPEPQEAWAKKGGFISANKKVSLDVYPDDLTRKMAEMIVSAKVARFDGSDLMPAAVGAGAFWKGVLDYVGG
ncbi:MAG: alpha-glucoside ABC transporter substrate-binding protein, partial [Marinomonas sp.]